MWINIILKQKCMGFEVRRKIGIWKFKNKPSEKRMGLVGVKKVTDLIIGTKIN